MENSNKKLNYNATNKVADNQTNTLTQEQINEVIKFTADFTVKKYGHIIERLSKE
ncbi:MAG: hypothetical protein OXU73_02475 [Candidatus Campbellbacteria bacterium]|nr:hypothetical protein [Candidatus Campbellbacteria bacterium]